MFFIVLCSCLYDRIGEAEDFSGAVAFLCLDEAKYITGEMIVITGGVHSRL